MQNDQDNKPKTSSLKKYDRITLSEDSNDTSENKTKKLKEFLKETGDMLETAAPHLARKGVKRIGDFLDSKGVANENINADTEKKYTEIESEKLEWHIKLEEIEAKKIENEREKMINEKMKEMINYLDAQNIKYYLDKDFQVVIFDKKSEG